MTDPMSDEGPMIDPTSDERPDGPVLPVSLLWPAGSAPATATGTPLTPDTIADLDLAPVLRALSGPSPTHERFVSGVLASLCTDRQVLAYRAAVLDDLLADPALCAALQALLPDLEALALERRPGRDVEPIQRIVQRLGTLDLFVDVALRLQHALDQAQFRARAMQDLHAALQALTATATFRALQSEVPGLREQLTSVGSVTIGLNLSVELVPESATILSLQPGRITGRPGLLERLLGHTAGQSGLTPLRHGEGNTDTALLRDLRRLLARVVTPVGDALDRYAQVHTGVLAGLGPELALLLNAAALSRRLQQAGLPVCRPQLAPSDERITHLEDGYNLSLALRLLDRAERASAGLAEQVVTNTIACDGGGRVWILTGPNRGGKTTVTRAIGLAHVLAQAGLCVPARAARLSPVDAIYTHFPLPETGSIGQGRLDDEARRLALIFAQATPHSLILLNEVLAGTSTDEALGLAFDAVRGLHLLGAQAIYVTHLHELARRVDDINARTPGDGVVVSVVAAVDTQHGAAERTYRLRRGPPPGLSYASEIAEQHGISFPQLARLLRSRGLAPEAADVGRTSSHVRRLGQRTSAADR